MWTQLTLMLLTLAVQGAGVVGARTKLLTSLKKAHLDSSNHFEPVAVDTSTSTFYFLYKLVIVIRMMQIVNNLWNWVVKWVRMCPL